MCIADFYCTYLISAIRPCLNAPIADCPKLDVVITYLHESEDHDLARPLTDIEVNRLEIIRSIFESLRRSMISVARPRPHPTVHKAAVEKLQTCPLNGQVQLLHRPPNQTIMKQSRRSPLGLLGWSPRRHQRPKTLTSQASNLGATITINSAR